MKKIFLFAVLILTQLSVWAKPETRRPSSYAFTRGVEAFNNDDYQEAFDWFKKELQDNPNNGYAHLYISALQYGNEEYGRALSSINQALKNISKQDKDSRAKAYAVLANIYLGIEDTLNALIGYSTAIKLDPKNKSYYQDRAEIYFRKGLYDLANADYRQIISIDPGEVMGYMGLGRNAKEQGQYEDAIPLFSYVIKIEPDYSSGYSFRAECYIAQKKYSEAIDDIIKALSIDGDDKAYYHLRSMEKSALSMIRNKLQIQAEKNPGEADWYFYLGRVHQGHKLFKEAIAFYEQANHRDAHAVFLEDIAHCYYDLGEFALALEYINRAIYMDETDYDFVMMKGNIYNELGRYTEAIAELDKYIKKYPDDFFGYYRRGWFKDEANDAEGAIEDYTLAITINPKYAYSYCGRGSLYYEQGKSELARADFKKVIALDTVPNDGSCAQYAFYFLGQKDKAIAFMDSIIAKDEDRAGSYYDATCLYSIMDEKEKALDYLAKAFECGYRRISHMSADHDLDNIRELPEYKALLTEYANKGFDENIDNQYVLQQEKAESVEVPFTKEGGVTKVKCTINGLPLHFIFDTGASDVTMSILEANFMLKNGYIKPEDIIGSARYMDANGDISEGDIVNLRTIDFGGLELNNVRAAIVRNQKAPLLLGQSVLGRIGKIEIDNSNMKLIITYKVIK